jgi:hypothetical protein
MSDNKYPFPLLSRRDGLDLIYRTLGFKVSLSKLEADVANGGGPKPAARFGKKYLYTHQAMLDYAKELVEPAEGIHAGPSRPRKGERRP